jgi:hypothetical protein
MVDDTLTITIDAQTDDFEAAIDDAIERVEALEAALDRLEEKHGDSAERLDVPSIKAQLDRNTTSNPTPSIDSMTFDDVVDYPTDGPDRRHQEGR